MTGRRAKRQPEATGTNPFDGISFRGVDSETWDDLVRLFMARGGPKYCWCMVWRSMPAGERRGDRDAKRTALESRVSDGVPIGILGYVNGEPVAWCSIAPRETYRRGLSGAASGGDGVWSIACFYAPRRLRGQGATRRLIAAAVEYAREGGASVVEAYPVEAGSPSYRFMGTVPSFRKAGFREIGTVGTRRHVMRLELEET